ncbi:shikimate dehydrogenase [Haematobacter massiliensis]|uniref:Shikimate dehydrogenase n=1 Tax=Haematobacter massiliensis TaxID=195105 RepID=A0A086Y6R7_9RHOB|nr:shikimate dehydrogenase [Haematobacter massiliensis]KFI29967.1 shikimate dehydrogenase [Haematobacter massiliensis]OWJ69436.1 shikimate dehydrogenase [Haematobacter massiliensis]OWJ86907.1 shikimate dehydrogenase [Haematobacter massiliensis]QBJ25476.1 shikimate dehydrogenase [Haematobacter massiliensis]
MTTPIRVGLIGAGIGRSRTPLLHMAEAAAQGFRLRYDLLDIETQTGDKPSLERLIAEAEAQGFAGLNITHPFKQAVLPLLNELSEDAAALGAVNTVVFGERGRTGHNTDWSGFLEGFRQALPDVPRTVVLQLGAGGAGAAVAYAAQSLKVERLLLSDMDIGRAEALAARMNAVAGRPYVHVVTDLPAAMQDAEGLINTTPMGMAAHPGLPLPAELLAPRHWVADVVYFPLVTPLLALARERGCRTMDGSGMAVFQAVGAFRLFTGEDADPQRMHDTFQAATRVTA